MNLETGSDQGDSSPMIGSELESNSASVKNIEEFKSPKKFGLYNAFSKSSFLVAGLALVLIVVVSLGGYLYSLLGSKPQEPAKDFSQLTASFGTTKLSLQGIKDTDQVALGSTNLLVINGQLQVNKAFLLAPSAAPASPTAGEIYYNQTTNQPYYFNGLQFISLAVPTIQGVTSLGGANGAIVLGNGLQIAGNQLSISSSVVQALTSSSINGPSVTSIQGLTGKITVTGSSNQIVVSVASGNIKLTLPQEIGTASNVQFGSLALGNGNLSLTPSAFINSDNISSVNNGDTLVLTGSNNVSFANQNGANTFSFPTSGGPGQVICTTAITCAAGGGQAVLLEPTGVQTASANKTSVFINKAGGTGNLIELQTGGIDQFVINNAGNTTINSLSVINGITSPGTLTVGSTSQPLVLQGNGLSELTATAGGFISTVDFSAPSTNRTITFPDLSGTVCLTTGNCLGGGGGGGANASLSNLSSVAINSNLLPGSAGAVNLGSATFPFGQLFLAGSSGTPGTNNFLVAGTSTGGTRTITLPDASGTVCLQNSVACGFAIAGSGVTQLNGLTGALSIANATPSGSTITINDATTLAKGIAEFNNSNFSVAGGVVNTIQNINSGATPSFSGLNLGTDGSSNGTLQLANSTNTNLLDIAGLAPSGSGTATVNIPSVAGGSTDTVCLETLANCVGTGGGVSTTGGTQNYVTKYNNAGATQLTSSEIYDNGSGVAIGSTTVTGLFNVGTASQFNVSNTGAITAVGVNSGTGLIQGTGGLTVSGGGTTTETVNGAGVTVQTTTNSATAFLVQNTSSVGVLYVDTVNKSVGINQAPSAGSALLVNGITQTSSLDISSSNTTNSLNKNFMVDGSVAQYDVVVSVNNGGTFEVEDTTTSHNPSIVGVSEQTGSNPSVVEVGIGGAYQVTADTGVVSIGDQLVTSSTSGEVTVDNNATTGVLGYATTSKAGGSSGLVGVFIRPVSGVSNPYIPGNLTIGTAGSTSGSIKLANSSNTNLDIIQGLTATGAGNASYTLPSLAAGGTDTFCLAALGNCTGANGGSGNTNYIENQKTLQSNANFNIEGAASSVTAVIQGANGGGDILDLLDNGGNQVAGYGSEGALTLGKPGSIAASLSFANSTNTNLLDIAGLAPSGSGTATVNIPSVAGGSTDTVCLETLANCVGTGGGVSTTGGTQNYVTKYNNAGATQLTSSEIYDNGSGVAIGSTTVTGLFNVGTASQFNVSNTGAITAVGVNSGTGLIQGTGGLTVSGGAGASISGGLNNNNGNITNAGSIGGVAGYTQTSGTSSITSTTTSGNIASVVDTALNANNAALNQLTFTNANGTGTATTVNGLSISPAGTASGNNVINAINLSNVSTIAGNQFNGLYFGTGYSNLLNYNGASLINGTGILQSAAVSGTYSNLTGTGALTTGSIGSGFGSISTTNSIATTSSLQGGTLNVAGGDLTVDGSGNLSTTGTGVFQGGLTVGNAGSATGNLYLANGTNGRLVDLVGLSPSGAGNATIQFPTIAGGATDTVCLETLANCVGTGGGVSTTGGTQNYVTKYNNAGATQLTSSEIYDNGSGVAIGSTTVTGLFNVGTLSQFQVSSGGAVQTSTSSASALTVNNLSGFGLLGVDTVGNNVNLGASGTTALSSTVNIATSTSATNNQTVNIGSLIGASAVNVQGGTGNISVNTGATSGTSGSINISTGNSSTGVSGNINIDNGTNVLTGTTLIDDTFEGTGTGSTDDWLDWFSTSLSSSNSQAHNGSHSLQISETSTFWGIQEFYNNLTVTAGDQYYFSAWFKSGTIPETIGGTVYWNNGSPLTLQSITDNTSGWTEVVGNGVAPVGATAAYVAFGAAGGNGDVQFMDDFQVEDLSSITNPNIGIGTSNAQAITIGNSNETGVTSLLSGGGGIKLASGINASINIGTSNNNNVNIGNGTGSAAVNIQGGTGNVLINTGAASGTTGSISLISGNSSGGDSGNVTIDTGSNVPGGTQVEDDTFETGTDNYGDYIGLSSVTQSNAEDHSGSNSLKLVEAGSGTWSTLSNSFSTPVTPGHDYSFTAWVLAGTASELIDGQAQWWNGQSGGTQWTQIADSTSGWVELTGSATAPPLDPGQSNEYLQMQFSGDNGNTNQVVYLDDVTVTDESTITQPSVNIGTTNAQAINIGSLNQYGATNINGGGGVNIAASSNGTINIGTNDSNFTTIGGTSGGDVILQASGVNQTLNGSSDVILSTSNSTEAFQVQNAAGTNLLNVDTSGNNINVGATGTTVLASTVNIGNSSGAAQNVNVGSDIGSSSTDIQGGTGNIILGTGGGTGNTGSILIASGNSLSGTSGNVSIDTGASAVSSGSNVENDTFESGLDGWTNGFSESIAQSTAQAHSGTHSMAITSTGGAWGNVGGPYPGGSVTAGQLYNFSEWVRGTVAENVTMYVTWYGAWTYNVIGTVTDSTTGWTEISGSVTAPAGATNVELLMQGFDGGGVTTYADDIMVSGGTSTPAVLLGATNAAALMIGNANEVGATTLQGGAGGVAITAATGDTIDVGNTNNNIVTIGNASTTEPITTEAEGITNTIVGSPTAPSEVIKSAIDSTTALQIQNAAGGSLFTADTQNNAIVLGNDGTPSNLTVRGGAAAGTNISGGNLTFDASNGTGSGGSGDLVFRTGSGADTAITTDSDAGPTYVTGVGSMTWSQTVGSGSNRLLMLSVDVEGSGLTVSTSTPPTFGAQTFSKLDSQSFKSGAEDDEVWYLKNPNTGTATVTVTFTGIANAVAGSISFNNVDQTTTFGADTKGFGYGTQASISVPSGSNQLVFDGLGSDTIVHHFQPISSQTPLWNYWAATPQNGASSKSATGSSTTMSWEDAGTDYWGDIGVAIHPSSTTPTTQDTLNNSLDIESNGNVVFNNGGTINTQAIINGTALVQPTSGNDSTTAFQVQNAASSDVFNVDTADNTVEVGNNSGGTTTPAFLYVDDESANANGNAQLTGQWASPSNWGIGSNSNTSDSILKIGQTNGNGDNGWGTNNINLLVAGTERVQPTTGNDSTTAFQIQNASSNNIFTVDTTDKYIVIGAGSTGESTPSLIVLDNKTGSSSDPSGVDGAMYYNATLAKFRCFENSTWENCVTPTIPVSYTLDSHDSATTCNLTTTFTVLGSACAGGSHNANDSVIQVDLTNASQVRVSMATDEASGGTAGCEIRLQYSTDDSTWSYMDGGTGPQVACDQSIGSSSWVSLVSGAKTQVYVRAVFGITSGTGTVEITNIAAEFK